MLAPPASIRNVPQWRKRCRQVRALAARIVSGEIGVLQGSSRMTSLMHLLHANSDPDFRPFIELQWESAQLPTGTARGKADLSALAYKDQEIASLEEEFRDRIIDAASRIGAKFVPNQPPDPTSSAAKPPAAAGGESSVAENH
jgi:hypothetical protein